MVDELTAWLARHGLERYAGAFTDNDVDLDLLPTLDDADLERLGLSLGHRRRLQLALQSEPVAAQDRSPFSGEAAAQRRVVTVLFCDLVGSTALSARLDPEELRALLAHYQDTCARVIQAEDGFLARYVGDGLLVYFGYPRAHEDDPERAVRAAGELVDAVASIESSAGERLAVRVGIATGPAVVGDIGQGARRESNAIVGAVPNLAARLQALAGPGEIVLAASTRERAPGFEYESLGPQSLKGFARPVEPWRVVGAGEIGDRFATARRRGLSPLVGRGDELDRLDAVWREAARGQVRVVSLAGEAGIGKSRLVHEFKRRVEGARPTFLEGHCSALGETRAFYPFIDVVRRAFRLDAAVDAPAREQRLEQGLAMAGLAPESHFPYLWTLLQGERHPQIEAQDEEAIGQRIRESLKAVLSTRCEAGPVVLHLNDLHWMDRSSERLLAEIGCWNGVPLLVLVTYRPQYEAAWTGELSPSSHYLISLRPFGREDARQLICATLDVQSVSEPTLEHLLGLTSGNPLFLEEMLRHLSQTGRLEIDQGVLRAVITSGDSIPDTLTGLLLQRVDELEPPLQRLLQLASVIGREFTLPALQHLLNDDRALPDELAALCHGQFLQQNSPTRFRFQHALVQEAVYRSLLAEEQARLHHRVAEQIEADLQLDPEERVSLLAEHYPRSSDHAKAFRYLALAGRQRFRVYALDDAASLLGRALTLAKREPDAIDPHDVLDTALDMSRVHYFRAEFARQIEFVREYVDQAERLNDEPRLAGLLFEAGYCRIFSGLLQEGRAVLERARAIYERLEDGHGLGLVDLGLGWIESAGGGTGREQAEVVRRFAASARAAGRRHRDAWLMAKADLLEGLDSMTLGRFGDARTHAASLARLSRELNDTRPRGMGLWLAAMTELMDGDPEAAEATALEAVQVTLSPVDRYTAQVTLHGARVVSGRHEAALGPLTDIVAELWRIGFAGPRVIAEAYLGVCEVLCGQLASGINRVRRVLAGAEQPPDGSPMGPTAVMVQVTLGELYLALALREEPLPARVLLANAGFLLRTLPRASRLASHTLEKAAERASAFDAPAILASALANQARLARHQGRAERAAELFRRAHVQAERGGAMATARRIAQAEGGAGQDAGHLPSGLR